MNRLILIGNGFDIAHGLETRYSDFLKFYWNRVINSYYKDELLEFENYYFTNGTVSLAKNSFSEVLLSFGLKNPREFNNTRYIHSNNNLHLDFKGYLFHYLNIRHNENNGWVDFEEAFYFILKKVKDSSVNSTYNIKTLNNELRRIANKFEQYLIDEVAPEINKKINSEMATLFEQKILINQTDILDFLKEFSIKSHNSIVENLNKDPKSGIIRHYAFKDTLVLNFNYTNTPLLYVDKSSVINIHGALNDELNPILLGFGDEKDKFYSEIEDLNDNDYLEFMKSTYYSKTSNYKRLFDYLDSDVFQVQIMGHSCGLSDRTLLNSIFQHENCRSIKVYYHEFEKPNSNGDLDNFTQITRNISRHFTDKVMMRERIVNKEYSNPLPQKLVD